MKVFVTIPLLATLLATATAADSVRGVRQLATAVPVKKVTAFSKIKLTGRNEIAPFEGVDYAGGSATVKLDYDSSRPSKWNVCIDTSINGFVPGLLRIYKAKITANGDVRVDFSTMLSEDDSDFSGCKAIAEDLFKDMRDNPEFFYVNAHIAATPTKLFNSAIRGQFIQSSTTPLVPGEAVSPLKGKSGASGTAKISFEAAGSIMCIDATIKGFDPLLAYLYDGDVGTNGDIVVNFSSKKVSAGRFNGCGTLKELGVTDNGLAAKILDNAKNFYFNFHQDKQGSGVFNTSIRGQLG